jgi:hypothetical protein
LDDEDEDEAILERQPAVAAAAVSKAPEAVKGDVAESE